MSLYLTTNDIILYKCKFSDEVNFNWKNNLFWEYFSNVFGQDSWVPVISQLGIHEKIIYD